MMKTIKNSVNTIPVDPDNPFRVPEGYFDSLGDKILARIKSDDEKQEGNKRKIYLMPYIALAASISGLALIIYIVLQSIIGSSTEGFGYYDFEILEETGIILDETLVAETYYLEQENAYNEWEEDAMVYLASNEVDLLSLLDTN